MAVEGRVMMSIFPLITKKRQALYEEIYTKHADLKCRIPEICGYYGRACRCMDNRANRMLCQGCSLSVFISTAEAINEQCNKKEALGIENLYDSDILDIVDALVEKCVPVDYSYVTKVLDYLTED